MKLLAELKALRASPPTSECIEWQGSFNPSGYGRIKVKGKTYSTHRWAWMQAYGDPGELFVLHSCDNRACYNLEHLRLGTHADNMQDRSDRNRCSNQYKGATHCKWGHEFTPENTYTYAASGKRMCRTCARRLNREKKARARNAR